MWNCSKEERLVNLWQAVTLCAYNVYDDEDECYYCEVDMDEDDAVRMSRGTLQGMSLLPHGDEYAVVRHQM